MARQQTNKRAGDVGFPPGEAQHLLLRAELILVSRRRIELFSLDALVNMLADAGMRVELRVKQAA